MADLDYNPVTRKSDLVLMASAISSFAVFVLFTSPEKALAYCMVFGAFLSVVQTKIKKQRDKRFWIIISALATVHVAVLYAVQVPKFRFGMMIMPFAFVDAFAIWGLVNWLERRFVAPPNPDPNK